VPHELSLSEARFFREPSIFKGKPQVTGVLQVPMFSKKPIFKFSRSFPWGIRPSKWKKPEVTRVPGVTYVLIIPVFFGILPKFKL
jgi:hypothetical protein